MPRILTLGRHARVAPEPVALLAAQTDVRRNNATARLFAQEEHLSSPYTVPATGQLSKKGWRDARNAQARGASALSSAKSASIDCVVPKPPGDPGKTNSGGYSIRIEMNKAGWSNEDYVEVRDFINRLVDERLNVGQSYSRQNEALVEAILAESLAKFPSLRNFKDQWASKAFIIMRLKATSQTARKKKKDGLVHAAQVYTGQNV